MKTLLSKSALALMAIGFAGLTAAQNIAVVNGKAIPKSRADALMATASAQARQQGQQLPPNFEAQVKEEVINREVLSQEAQKRGMDATDDYKAKMEQHRQLTMIQALIENERKTNPPSDAEAKAKYDEFAKANAGKEYRARHILVEKEADAKTIIANLKKGAKFEDIAKKQSKDPGSGANGGDLDWANAGSYVKEFSDAMVALKKGQLTDAPVKSQFGYHIIRLDDVRDAQVPKFEEMKPQILQEMGQEKLQAFIKGLRDKAKIE